MPRRWPPSSYHLQQSGRWYAEEGQEEYRAACAQAVALPLDEPLDEVEGRIIDAVLKEDKPSPYCISSSVGVGATGGGGPLFCPLWLEQRDGALTVCLANMDGTGPSTDPGYEEYNRPQRVREITRLYTRGLVILDTDDDETFVMTEAEYRACGVQAPPLANTLPGEINGNPIDLVVGFSIGAAIEVNQRELGITQDQVYAILHHVAKVCEKYLETPARKAQILRDYGA
jgi:hypothetical protein